MNIKVKKLDPTAILPTYAREGDAGMDLYALEDCTIYSDRVNKVRTGISVQIPVGYVGDVRSRSGLALKQGITVSNSPGTVDPGYRGEVGVLLSYNGQRNTETSKMTYAVNPDTKPRNGERLDMIPSVGIAKGDRIGQLVVQKFESVIWEEVTDLDSTERGAGGFGSSGVSNASN